MLAACRARSARDRRVVPAGLDPCPRAGRGADPQPLLPDRLRRRDRGELRQDPHVRRRSLPAASYREILDLQAGRETSVLAETPWGVLGMTICYDLRFPYLYRDLAHAGATMLSIPSSFTVPTGQAHWHALMRARADRDRLLRVRAGPGRHAQGLQPQDLRPFGRRRAVGRGAGRCRRREGGLRRGAMIDLGQGRRGAQDGAVADARPEVRRAGAAQGGDRQGRGVDSAAVAPRSAAPSPSSAR